MKENKKQIKKRIVFFSLDLSNTFNELLMEGIYKRATELNIDLFVVTGGRLNSPDDWEKQQNLIYQWVRQNDFDGILFSNIFSFINIDQKSKFLKNFEEIPKIVLVQSTEGIPVVKVDNTAGFKSLLEHLIINQKCSKIAAITGPEKDVDSIERYNTFKNVLLENNIKIDTKLIYHGTYGYQSGIAGVKTLLDERHVNIDALVCFNDNMAIAALSELKKRGVIIPDDIIITGFDNTVESYYVNPPLSTVSYPMYELGQLGVEMLADKIDGKDIPWVTNLQSQFLLRKSSDKNISDKSLEPLFYLPEELKISAKCLTIGNLESCFSNIWFEHLSKFVLRKFERILNVDQEKWLFSICKSSIEIVLTSIKENKFSNLKEFFEKQVYSDYKNEWSYEFWPLFLSTLMTIIIPVSDENLQLNLKKIFNDAISISHNYYNNFLIQKKIMDRKLNEYMLQIGEDLSTAFNVKKIGSLLNKKLGVFGIDTCIIVLYDKKIEKAKIIAQIEKGELVDNFDTNSFPSKEIFPAILKEKYPSMVMEALYVKEESFGYVLFNLGNKLGLTYKSLRYYISSSIKGAYLIDIINNYSISLEDKVVERTRELVESNENVVREIEKREKIEKELIKQRNLKSLGILAGGIAHDFNNILTGILGNVSLLEVKEITEKEKQTCCNDIISATKNAIDLTHQLLTFSKGGAPIKKSLSIAPLVEDISRFNLRGTAVKPFFKFEKDLKNGDIDPNQINQVLSNIIINAVQAMPDGGKIFFEGKMYFQNENTNLLKKGEYIKLSIQDTGEGIAPKKLEQIFDPYFSTKEKNVGLGLATAIAVMKRHGGNIKVESTPGKGTTFYLFLPVSNKKTTDIVTNKKIESEFKKNCKILILDDEIFVAKILHKLLETLGHEAVITTNGEDTIEVYNNELKKGKAFDALILDLTIPGGLSGHKVLEEILKIDKNVKAIVSSGYSKKPILSNYRKYGFKAILKKPYTIEELKEVLNKIL